MPSSGRGKDEVGRDETGWGHGDPDSRPSVRAADAVARATLHGARGRDARDRDRSEHRGLQRGRRRAASAPAVSGSRAPRHGVARRDGGGRGTTGLVEPPRRPGPPGGAGAVRGHGRVGPVGADAHGDGGACRPRRGTDEPRDVRSHPARAARSGPGFPPGGRRGGCAAGRAPEPPHLAHAFRRRPGRGRAQRLALRDAVHGDRRDAGGLPSALRARRGAVAGARRVAPGALRARVRRNGRSRAPGTGGDARAGPRPRRRPGGPAGRSLSGHGPPRRSQDLRAARATSYGGRPGPSGSSWVRWASSS